MSGSTFSEVWQDMTQSCLARLVPHLASELQRAGHNVSENELLTILNLASSAYKNEPIQQELNQRLPAMFGQNTAKQSTNTKTPRAKKSASKENSRCQAKTQAGNQCSKSAKDGNIYCAQHAQRITKETQAPLEKSSFMNMPPLSAKSSQDTQNQFRPHPKSSGLMVDSNNFVLNGDVVVARYENGSDRELNDQERTQAHQNGYKVASENTPLKPVQPTTSNFGSLNLNRVPGLKPMLPNGTARSQTGISLPTRPQPPVSHDDDDDDEEERD